MVYLDRSRWVSVLIFLICIICIKEYIFAQSFPIPQVKNPSLLFMPPPKSVLGSHSLLLNKPLIVIDPGHGGHDIGTQSVSKPRYQEKSFNLVTAQLVRDYLEAFGYRVLMTRDSDVFISLEKRSDLANINKPALFISIHYNAAPSAEAQGVEIFFYQSKTKSKRSLESKRLAYVVLKYILSYTKAKSRGIKSGNYAVIRETNMPAILVEGGFMTNESELQNLKNPTYIKRLAWGIAYGANAYLHKEK